MFFFVQKVKLSDKLQEKDGANTMKQLMVVILRWYNRVVCFDIWSN
jgi:hypothetical protein